MRVQVCQPKRLSQSADRDRESYGGMVRTSTFGTLPGRNLGTLTPVTPAQMKINANLPMGSVRPSRYVNLSAISIT